MPTTRKAEKIERDSENPDQLEVPPAETTENSTAPDSKSGPKEDEASVKAKERKDRFKALQARAVCGAKITKHLEFACEINIWLEICHRT